MTLRGMVCSKRGLVDERQSGFCWRCCREELHRNRQQLLPLRLRLASSTNPLATSRTHGNLEAGFPTIPRCWRRRNSSISYAVEGPAASSASARRPLQCSEGEGHRSGQGNPHSAADPERALCLVREDGRVLFSEIGKPWISPAGSICSGIAPLVAWTVK